MDDYADMISNTKGKCTYSSLGFVDETRLIHTSLLTIRELKVTKDEEKWNAVSGCMQQHEAQTAMATSRAMHIVFCIFITRDG